MGGRGSAVVRRESRFMSMPPEPIPASLDDDAPPFGEAQFRGVTARRFAAHMLDWFFLLFFIAMAALAIGTLAVLSFGLLAPPMMVATVVLPFLYFTVFTGGHSSATPGMRLVGVELRDISGMRPDRLQAGVRAFLYFVTWGMTCGLLFLWVAFDARGRALHDVLTSSVVVRRREGD